MITQMEVSAEAAPAPIVMQRDRRRRIRIRQWTKSRVYTLCVFSTLIALTVYTLATMEYGEISLATALGSFFKDLYSMFLTPKLSGRFEFVSLLKSLGITICLSVLTTMLSALGAFLLSLLAARNLSPRWLSQGVRVLMSFIRAVPTILWVLIFSIIAGLGAEAAVVGMCFHGIAYLTKAYSESIEEIDIGVIEALRAAGASWWQIVFQAVLPSSLTALLSWTFLRFEINFTNAVAVGAAAGAGGIGFELFMVSGFYFDFRELGIIVYMTMLVAAALELISMKLRSAYLVKS